MKSPRKKIIDKTKAEIKKILYIKQGRFCFFCGKSESHFKYPLSIFHILPVGSHPRLELTIENIVLACWAKEYFIKCCHNVWEDRVEPFRSKMEEQLKQKFGKDYKDKLLLIEQSNPPLNKFRAMNYYYYYKQELKKLKEARDGASML